MILLVRHGETASNAARVVQTPETPLSPRGVQQAERIAERLKSFSVSRILTSDLPRALETAQRVQAATGAPLALEPLLQERNFGDIRGTPYSKLGFDLFGPNYAPPGGESWEAFHQRVDRAWARVRAEAAAGANTQVVAEEQAAVVAARAQADRIGRLAARRLPSFVARVTEAIRDIGRDTDARAAAMKARPR